MRGFFCLRPVAADRLEEAARDLGATPRRTLWHVIVPVILPSLIGVGLFGFTLS